MNIKQYMTLKQIDELQDHFCEQCIIRDYLQKEHNKLTAHRYCIKKCSVGIKIKRIGNELH